MHEVQHANWAVSMLRGYSVSTESDDCECLQGNTCEHYLQVLETSRATACGAGQATDTGLLSPKSRFPSIVNTPEVELSKTLALK